MKLRYSLMLGALLILAGTSCEDKLDIPQKGWTFPLIIKLTNKLKQRLMRFIYNSRVHTITIR